MGGHGRSVKGYGHWEVIEGLLEAIAIAMGITKSEILILSRIQSVSYKMSLRMVRSSEKIGPGGGSLVGPNFFDPKLT